MITEFYGKLSIGMLWIVLFVLPVHWCVFGNFSPTSDSLLQIALPVVIWAVLTQSILIVFGVLISLYRTNEK